MDSDSVTLKWGDIVRIHGVNLSKKKTTKGLLISKGFTDANIYYQIYEQFSQVNFYRQSLFQILPRVNLDMHDALLEQLTAGNNKQKQKNRSAQQNQKNNQSESKLQNLRNRADGELLILQSTLKQKAGKPINYGSQVIFRHIESRSYIFGMMQAANSGEGAFKIQVSQSLSSGTIFKLISPRTFQNQNDIIYYNAALKVYHPSSDSYMNFSQQQQPIYLDDIQQDLIPASQSHQSYDYISKRPSIKQPISKRTFIMNENKAKCFWKFIQHCTYSQYNNKQKIKSHDIVYFKHTKKQQQSLISTTISAPLRCYLKQNLSGNLSYQCFWELIPKQVNQFGPENCNVFLARNIVTGQLLQYAGFNVQIEEQTKSEGRGFDSGGLINLICYKSEDNKKTRKLQAGIQNVIQLEDDQGRYSKLIQKQQKQQNDQEGQIKQKEEEQQQIIEQSKQPPVKLSKIQKIYELKSRKFSLKSVPILPKDIFMIYKVDEQVLLDAMYVISAHQPLIRFVQKLSGCVLRLQLQNQGYASLFSKDNFKQEALNDIVKILKLLAGKIYDTDYQNIAASGNTPNKIVQQILVESGVVRILIQILYNLYYPFTYIDRNCSHQIDRAISIKIQQIFQYTYRLVEKVAANFQQNRIYISRWIDLFLEHSNNINQPYIQQCLVGILRDNPSAIRATITQQKIKNLIQKFLTEASQIEGKEKAPLTTKYLKLFSTFIVCQNSVIKQNQNIILDNFFKNPKNKFNFKFKVDQKFEGAIDQQNDPYKVKSKEVLVSFAKTSYVNLKSFAENQRNKWDYLMAYINLLADICKDRNSNAIQYVQSILSLQAVAVILFDTELLKSNKSNDQQGKENLQKVSEENLTENIHQPFIRIAHHVYVDNHKFQQINRIKRISQWYAKKQQKPQNSQSFQDIIITARDFQGQKQSQEYRYLQSILEYIKTYIKGCNQNASNLNMLNIVLSLLKSTVILGLWTSIKYFRELSPDLMLKIAKIENTFFFEKKQNVKNSQIVKNNTQKLKMNRPQIALGIQCKIKAIQIFKYMSQLQIDIRMRYIMNFFKGLYQCTQDFNVYDLPYDDEKPQQSSKEKTQEEKQMEKRDEFAKQQYFKMQGKALFGDTVKKISEDTDIILKENVWLNKLKQLTPFQYKFQQDQMKNRYLFQGDQPSAETQQAIKQQFNTIVLGLFQLSVYENNKLLNSSLNMLRIMFEQRKDLLSNFKTILICGKGNLQQVYTTLKFMREKFNMLAHPGIKNYKIDKSDNGKTFPFQIKKQYDYLIKDRQNRSGIIQDLFFLARTLKQGTSLKNIQALMLVDQEIFLEDTTYTFINQKQKNNSLFQSLNLAQQIYKPLFEYIKIMSGPQKIDEIHRKLLIAIFQYLTLLCFNNLEAKQILMHYIEYILPHLQNKVGAASFLYEVTRNNKLLVSNEQLVSLIIQKALHSCITRQLGPALMGYILSLGLKDYPTNNKQKRYDDIEISRILFSLRGVLLFNDQGHKRNQQLLMNKLQQNKYSRLIFQKHIVKKDKPNQSDFNLSPQQTLIVYSFELYSVLVESGNMINIGKLQNLHPYEYCLDLMENTDRWEIRRALRGYINRLYYVNKDKDIFLFQKFVSKQFTILNTQLGQLIDLHKKKLLSQDLKIKNAIRFSFVQSQIFIFIIQCLIALHQMFLKPGFIAILRRQLAKDQKNTDAGKPLHQSFIRLFKNLGCLNKIYEQVKILGPFIKEVKRLFCIELQRMPVRYLEKKAQPDDQKNKNQAQEAIVSNQGINVSMEVDKQKKQKKGYLYDHSKSFFRNLSIMLKSLKQKENLEKLKQQHVKFKKQINVPEQSLKIRHLQTIFGVPNQKLRPYYSKKVLKKIEHYDPHLQTASSRIFKVLAKPELQQDEQNIQLNSSLNQVKMMVEDLPIFDKFKDDEFIFFVNTVLNLDQTSQAQYADYWKQYANEKPKPVIPTNDVFTNIFKLIRQNPDKIDDKQKIFVIKMVRCFITQAIQGGQQYKLSVDKWDEDYTEGSDAFASRQQQIQKCGGSDFIISIFKQNLNGRVQLLNEALLLGIAYLFGGNPTCQNSILDSLKQDPQNVMMINIKNLIKSIGDFLMNIRKIKQNQKKRNFAYNIVDTYDYFNPEDKMICKYFSQTKIDKFEVQIELDNEKALCRIFRFLQLFCENNNKDMKKFLSTQINQDGNRKTNNINFIQQASILLKKLFQIMNSKLVNIPSNLLAFIGEVTQIPIIENQRSFIKSTFFQDISYMAEFFDTPQNKLQRKFNLASYEDNEPLQALNQIYRQAIKLALGNFEGNQDDIIKQFLNKCKPKLMWLIIRDELWLLIKRKYTNKHFYVNDPTSETQSRRRTFKKLDEHAINQIILEQQRQMSFGEELITIIQVLSILRKVQDYAFVKQKLIKGNKEIINKQDVADLKRAKDFRLGIIKTAQQQQKYQKIQNLLVSFDKLILQIQVNCQNGISQKLQYIYFPKQPVFEYLAPTTKDRIMAQVTRQTPRDKLISLLSFKQQVYQQIKSNYSLNFFAVQKKFLGYTIKKQIPITSKLCETVRYLSTICSMVIIALMFLLMIAQHQIVLDRPTTYFEFQRSQHRWILQPLCLLHLSLMVLYLIFWYTLRGDLAYKKYKKSIEQQGQQPQQQPIDESSQQQKPAIQQQKQPQLPQFLQNLTKQTQNKQNQLLAVFYLKKALVIVLTIVIKLWNKFSKIGFVIKLKQKLKNFGKNLYKNVYIKVRALFNQPQFNSILFFLIISILGNISGKQWYIIHLFNLFVGIPQLINVFKAIINNIQRLALLSFLTLIFVVVFNIISLSTYVPSIYQQQLPQQSCQSIVDCILTVYTSGAIGDDMQTFEFGKFSFNVIYVVYIEMLFQNLFGGIIIDAYTSLTQQDKQRNKDKQSNCYICSKTRPNIQKQGETLQKHIARHFLWNYLYYIYCLENKSQTDYTGIEYIIKNKIDDQDVSWFPSEGGEDGDAQLQSLMNQLKEKLTDFKTKESEIINKMNSINQEAGKKMKNYPLPASFKSPIVSEVAIVQ